MFRIPWPKLSLPQAIDDDTGGERVFRARDPTRESHATAADRPSLERGEPNGRWVLMAGDAVGEVSLYHSRLDCHICRRS